MRESKIEEKVVAHCRRQGYYCRKLTTPNNRGIPDRFIAHGGKSIFLELKATGKEPTDLQYHEMGLLRKAGMKTDWADSVEEAIQLIDDWLTEDVL